MKRHLRFTSESAAQLQELAATPAQKGLHKQVLKPLGLLQINTRHPGLNVHPYHSKRGAGGETLWEAYIQNKTPGAYRLFFHYGPDELIDGKRVPTLTVLSISPHP